MRLEVACLVPHWAFQQRGAIGGAAGLGSALGGEAFGLGASGATGAFGASAGLGTATTYLLDQFSSASHRVCQLMAVKPPPLWIRRWPRGLRLGVAWTAVVFTVVVGIPAALTGCLLLLGFDQCAYSGRCRPPVPEHAGPGFRSVPGHCSG